MNRSLSSYSRASFLFASHCNLDKKLCRITTKILYSVQKDPIIVNFNQQGKNIHPIENQEEQNLDVSKGIRLGGCLFNFYSFLK